jgi:hypothetical protein
MAFYRSIVIMLVYKLFKNFGVICMLVIGILTDATAQSPSLQADSRTTGQETPRVVWSLKSNRRIH